MSGRVVAGRKGIGFVLFSGVLGPTIAFGLMIGSLCLWGALADGRLPTGPNVANFFVQLLPLSAIVCAPVAVLLSGKPWLGTVISRRRFLYLSYFSAALSPAVVVTVLAGLNGQWTWAPGGYPFDVQSMLGGLALGMIFIGPFGLLSGGVLWWLGGRVGLLTGAVESTSS